MSDIKDELRDWAERFSAQHSMADMCTRAADEIERLTEMRDYWHRMFWKERERALKAENALYALKGGERGGEAADINGNATLGQWFKHP